LFFGEDEIGLLNHLVLNNSIGPPIRRGGLLLFFAVVCFLRCSRGLRRFLDKKVTKKSRQQGGFLAARAIALQTGQNHGL
jgi:hypothetical protein